MDNQAVSIRAIILGLLLGLGVSAATYFNDSVIRQTMLIGNHLPLSIFGTAVVLLLVVNPLLRLFGPRGPLRGGEIAIIVALGLAACGWPGSGYFRGFDTIVGLPAHWIKAKTNWQTAEVMSYVPGGAAAIAPGHVQDWPATLQSLQPDAAQDAAGPAPGQTATLPAVLWDQLSPDGRTLVGRLSNQVEQGGAVALSSTDQIRLLRVINTDLIAPVGAEALWRKLEAAGLLPEAAQGPLAERARLLEAAEASQAEAQTATESEDPSAAAAASRDAAYLQRQADHQERHANRAALSALLGDAMLPAPEGEGVLVAGAQADPFVVDTLLQGRAGDPLSMTELPWRAWWPPIRLWWTLALLLGVAALMMTLVVHPQWSRRELLPYPIARFIEEASEWKAGSWLPEIAKNRLFWVGFVALMLIHLLNGLHTVVDESIPQLKLAFDFTGLRTLFPNASIIGGSHAYFTPTIYLSVVAFAFFLTTSVSLSLGISQLLFLMLGSAMLNYGMAVDQAYADAKPLSMMRFGSYLGFTAMILYIGRRYYAQVVGSAFGMPRAEETPLSAVWAMRGLMAAALGAVLVLKTAGLGWILAVLFVLIVLMIFLVVTRIVVETGAFFVQSQWVPMAILVGLFGFEVIGPTAYIVLGIASLLIAGDPREAIMPYLANGLQMADRSADTRPARVAPWMAVVIIAGFFVAGSMTMLLQYEHGLGRVGDWTKKALPEMTFDQVAQYSSDAAATGTLQAATVGTFVERLDLFRPIPGGYLWVTFGIVLVVATAAARLRLPWWPLHPVAFLVWGTYPISMFAFSFLLGWIVKAGVVRTMGAKGYHAVKPLMVGIIAGELLAGLLWIATGATYWYIYGLAPTTYSIFPG